ncbi:hypothetical protein ACHQM5_014782 [Ranunculus cassubicifolius]
MLIRKDDLLLSSGFFHMNQMKKPVKVTEHNTRRYQPRDRPQVARAMEKHQIGYSGIRYKYSLAPLLPGKWINCIRINSMFQTTAIWLTGLGPLDLWNAKEDMDMPRARTKITTMVQDSKSQ